jgi:uncharacterized protein (TIGR04141 family)
LSADDLIRLDYESPSGQTPEWSARVYFWPGPPQPPAWAKFLQKEFADLAVPDTVQSRAVVVVRVAWKSADRLFAVTFGGGRFQLRRGATERSYGLRVALNAIYEGDSGAQALDAVARIRQVDTRTVGANTMRTRRQTNRSAEFDVFELDPEGDQLNGITGSPLSGTGLLGKRVTGSDSLRVARSTLFSELGKICRELAKFHERKDYERRFKFVDNYRRVSAASRIAKLNEALAEAVGNEDSDIQFSVPSLLDYDEVGNYRIEAFDLESSDLDIADIRAALAAEGHLSFESLQDKSVQVISDDGGQMGEWPLSACLDGQLTVDGGAYVVESGEYFEIAPHYLAGLDDYMDTIGPSTVVLPDSVRVGGKEISEGKYNENAAKSSPDFLLMDKRTVTIEGKTSPIEVCDVLTLQGQLIHVKRKFSSSSLSHLFGQGYVSSELLVDSAQYRQSCRNVIGAGEPKFQALFPDAPIVPANYEIVYAIVEKWGQRKLRGIPFFSKINLRKHARGLRRMGFSVSYAAVKVV